MNQLDTLLARLAEAPVPDRLAFTEHAVLARISSLSATRARTNFGATTIGFALAIGVIGATVPTEEASASRTLSPLGPISSLAPSVLLVGER